MSTEFAVGASIFVVLVPCLLSVSQSVGNDATLSIVLVSFWISVIVSLFSQKLQNIEQFEQILDILQDRDYYSDDEDVIVEEEMEEYEVEDEEVEDDCEDSTPNDEEECEHDDESDNEEQNDELDDEEVENESSEDSTSSSSDSESSSSSSDSDRNIEDANKSLWKVKSEEGKDRIRKRFSHTCKNCGGSIADK
jgi:hypothetical protein